MNSSENTAVLLFSRTAMEEATVKVFKPELGKRGNGTIARRLIRHTVATVRKSRIPLIRCSSPDQSGNSFGERLANAMEAAFAQGYSRVIAIGNDCPAISASMLNHATQQLETKDLILGPAADGGVFLIGMRRSAYQRLSFVSLPWQKEVLQDSWLKYAEFANLDVCWLAQQNDINNAADFRSVVAKLGKENRLRQQLLSIVRINIPWKRLDILPIQARFSVSALVLRGPPQ